MLKSKAVARFKPHYGLPVMYSEIGNKTYRRPLWLIKKNDRHDSTNSLMIRKFKNIISLFLLLVFILPSIIKLEHHHAHFECKAKNEKHFHECHEKCAICSFEFSVFSSDYKKFILPKEQPVAKFCNNYRSVNYSSLSKYSFSLRAPPYRQI